MPPKRRSRTGASSTKAPSKKAKRGTSEDSENASPSAALPESTVLKPYDHEKVYRLLEPGPVVLVTTSTADGACNVMTMGFHMVVQHGDPPLLAACIGPWDHSHAALSKTGECVLCIPGADLAQKVVDIGNCSGSEVDKFAKFGLTARRASEVGAPLIEECLACVECKVRDRAMAKKYNLWILEVVGAWTNSEREEKRTLHHKGIGNFALDGEEIDLHDRMILWKEFQDD